jgi:hypothetical protein
MNPSPIVQNMRHLMSQAGFTISPPLKIEDCLSNPVSKGDCVLFIHNGAFAMGRVVGRDVKNYTLTVVGCTRTPTAEGAAITPTGTVILTTPEQTVALAGGFRPAIRKVVDLLADEYKRNTPGFSWQNEHD